MVDQNRTAAVDLFIIGGGVNGCGIARDATGRGFSVTLAEMNDLASGTSSNSTKLFHGGLRYLEYFEFGLVAKALKEREVLLNIMPHISWPMRFVIPLSKDMRFDSSTPTSRLLAGIFPWMKGRRPFWLIRLGLFLYDHLGGRKILKGTSALDLTTSREGTVLFSRFHKAYEYSDCWIDDARLVVLNARDAQMRGAQVLTHTKVLSARFDDGLWQIETETSAGERHTHFARMIVNAAGPWVGDITASVIGRNAKLGVRLVRGSHIVTPKLYDHDKAYFFQGSDGRIIFAIPYETDFTLIGTTEAEHAAPNDAPQCSDEEAQYLLDFANQYLKKPLSKEDIHWTYSGVRPLFNDGSGTASAATRDYVLNIDDGAAGPLLNIYGGKITTYRQLAEDALDKIQTVFNRKTPGWTHKTALPGGDFRVNEAATLVTDLTKKYSFLSDAWATRLICLYGTDAFNILGTATTLDDLGVDFGATLSEAEVTWMMRHEFARTAEDVVWCRSKLGLRLTPDQITALEDWMANAPKDLFK